MKTAVGILLFVLCGTCFAEDAEILSIRKEYQAIQDALPHLKASDFALPDELGATEGANTTAYRDRAGRVRAIVLAKYWETGKDFEEYYYYRDGKLMFVFTRHLGYNQHPGITPEVAKQEGFAEAFDPKKSSISDNRYYFGKKGMIRWLDEHKKQVDPDSKAFADAAKGLVETSKTLLARATPARAAPRGARK